MRDGGFLVELKDGTIKQRNPFTGTEVWTIPGRANRPVAIDTEPSRPLDPRFVDRTCVFCAGRYLDTPPEKSRIARGPDGTWQLLTGVGAEHVFDTVADFRRVPNLYEILSLDYWRANYKYELPPRVVEHQAAYLATPAGRAHVSKLLVAKREAASGGVGSQAASPAIARREGPLDALAEASANFFGGGHDVIVARRHYIDGATNTSQLAGSGSLTPDEHAAYTWFTADSARNLLELNGYARYVVIFQNWLKPAGASNDHLHKQIVAIDEHGARQDDALQRLRENRNIFNDVAVNYAMQNNLVIAENDHAIAFAGFGHRYPAVEIYSKAPACEPWSHTPEELRGVSDILHAMHAATGAEVATNEEWHYRPLDGDEPSPWRIVLKWRVSTIAGFEGATKIYLNTISPAQVRERVLQRLGRLRAQGKIAPMRIGDECSKTLNPLKYLSARPT